MNLYCSHCSKNTLHDVLKKQSYIPHGDIQPVLVQAKCSICGNGGTFVTNGGRPRG